MLVNIGAKASCCTFFIKSFLALATRSLTMPSFTALAATTPSLILCPHPFTDCQKLAYVKQQNVALPFTTHHLPLSTYILGRGS